MTEEQAPSRRGFLSGVIYILAALIGAALGAPTTLYLFVPPRLRKAVQWVEAADVSQLDSDQPQELTFRRTRIDGWKMTSEKASVWVVKLSDKNVVAYSPWCTHLGCAYHWDTEAREFQCPCHDSIFSKDGSVLAGPAPRPLDRYEVKLEGEKLWIGPLRKSHETAA